MSDRRTYILDTSVLLAAGSQALRAFEEHEVVLPLVCVTELESRRNDPEIGWIARQVLRSLEDLRLSVATSGQGLRDEDGVKVNDSGGTLRIELNHVDQSGLPSALHNLRGHDLRILAVASALQAERSDRQVVVVSRDLPMRLIAGGVLGLHAEDYRNDQAIDSGYTGLERVEVAGSDIDHLFADRQIPLPDGALPETTVNTGVILTSDANASALTRIGADRQLHLVRDQEAFGIKGRSAEQRIALAHLLDPEIGIVSLGGRAGTGKTALALAAGLEAVLETKSQEKITVFRPMYSVGGQDLGFLPGTEEEKMAPWAAAVYDALEAIASPSVREEIEARNLLEVLPLTHIRGRTLQNRWIIIDEAQNLERPVLLSALSRLGTGSKVAMCSDVAQRDNLHVGRHDGIATVIERLKGHRLFAHITLTRSERSEVAELVTSLLDGD
jgi:PhoH-like ATPase